MIPHAWINHEYVWIIDTVTYNLFLGFKKNCLESLIFLLLRIF